MSLRCHSGVTLVLFWCHSSVTLVLLFAILQAVGLHDHDHDSGHVHEEGFVLADYTAKMLVVSAGEI